VVILNQGSLDTAHAQPQIAMVRYVQPNGCLYDIVSIGLSDKTTPIDKKFQENIWTTKMCPAMQYFDVITNPRWWTAAILKIAKSQYFN